MSALRRQITQKVDFKENLILYGQGFSAGAKKKIAVDFVRLPMDDSSYVQNVVTPLRKYQKRICRTLDKGNHLIILPTGAGKTLIAAECILKDLRNQSTRPVLFFVPTRQLVQQQAEVICNETKLVVAQLKGGSKLQPGFEVLVSTPGAFLQLNPNEFNIAFFSLVIFDEVHHAVKKHPYRLISENIREVNRDDRPRVIGLSASPTYSINELDVLRAIKDMKVLFDLHSIHTAEPAELRESGYHALSDSTKVFDEVPLVEEDLLPGQRALFSAENVRSEFFNALRAGLAHPLLHQLVDVINSLESEVQSFSLDFESPLINPDIKLKDWGLFAMKKSQIAFKKCSPQNITCLEPFYRALWHLYEALRISVITRQCDVEQTALYIHMSWMVHKLDEMFCRRCNTVPVVRIDRLVKQVVYLSTEHLKRRAHIDPLKEFIIVENVSPNTVDLCTRAQNAEGKELPSRLRKLKERLVCIYDDQKSRNVVFKGIVFVQARYSTHLLNHFVDQDADLSQRFRCTYVFAAHSNSVAGHKCSSSQTSERFEDFRRGVYNLLIATVMAEEGIDISSSNCVIRFDSVNTPVSYVQGRGRARDADSNFSVLIEKRAKPVSLFMVAETNQRSIFSEVIHSVHNVSDQGRSDEDSEETFRDDEDASDHNCSERQPAETASVNNMTVGTSVSDSSNVVDLSSTSSSVDRFNSDADSRRDGDATQSITTYLPENNSECAQS